MNWNRALHILGAVSSVVVGVGPQLLPVIPPAWGAGLGIAIALASNLNRIIGRQEGQPSSAPPP